MSLSCRQRGAVVAALLALAAGFAAAQQATPAELQAGSVAAGAALFSGKIRLALGGPACIACHSAGGLPFPNGGTLGPDLTHAYTRMGAQGIDSALTTLYFPAMYPLYRTRPLTARERADLADFLRDASNRPAPSTTAAVAALGLAIFVIFMLIIGYAGRDRLLGVRRSLLASARRRFENQLGQSPMPSAGEIPKAVRGTGESH
ncbi:MAG: hypothetical protein ACRD1C_08065 [Terriglobales bacterium]